jgi:hypothetical protein
MPIDVSMGPMRRTEGPRADMPFRKRHEKRKPASASKKRTVLSQRGRSSWTSAELEIEMSVKTAKFHSREIVMKALSAMGRITVIMASKTMQEGKQLVAEIQQKMAGDKEMMKKMNLNDGILYTNGARVIDNARRHNNDERA